MAEEKEEMDKAEEKKPAKKPFLRYMLLGGIVMALGAGGYVGWDLFVQGRETEDKKETRISKSSSKSKGEEVRISYPLESFIVNLMDKAGLGKRYLKVKITLEIGDEEDKRILDRHKPQLKDTILLLLSSQFFDDISTVEGKLELKQALLSRINQVLGSTLVHRIYFTEFVVQ